MASTAPAADSRWLHGPFWDGVLGTGLLFVPVLAALLLFPELSRASGAWVPLLVLLTTTPHLGATLVRVYERAPERRAYRLFAVHATWTLAALFALALYVPLVGSVLITLYLTVVTWHFTGQNYGIALVFLRRAGVPIAPTLKRGLYLAFVLPWVFWTLSLHGMPSGDGRFGDYGTSGTVYRFLSLGIPEPVGVAGVQLAGLLYMGALLVCAYGLFRVASLRLLLPALGLLLTQFLWYGAPVVAPGLDAAQGSGALYTATTVMWIQILHALQYLWITTYYTRRERPGTGQLAFLGKAGLAGSFVFGFPLLMMAPELLGPLSYDAGLYLIFVSALNLHHVMMDGVIWKLRHRKIARVLIDGAALAAPAEPPRRRSPWRTLVWASGAAGIVLTLAHEAELEFGVRRAWLRGDPSRLATAAERLTWMGRDSYEVRSQLGFLLAQSGEDALARRELERSLALHPTAAAWINLGALHERAGRLREALRAYDSARSLEAHGPVAAAAARRVTLRLDAPR